MFASEGTPLNELLVIVGGSVLSTVMLFSFVQLWNAVGPMLPTKLGILILSSFPQLLNELLPILVKPSDIVILVRLEHP